MARPKNDAPAAEKVRLTPNVEVIERRIANPIGRQAEPIKLKLDKPYHPRWFNGRIDGRIHQATSELGWIKVERSWLVDEQQLGGLTDMGDGYVRRGERGEEWLMVMYEEDWQRVQRAKADARAKKATPKAQKEQMAQDMAVHFGSDESSAALMGTHPNVQITGSIKQDIERVPVSEL